MFIKKIILDGFKSYGKRVEISGFDPMFNAITGFNGSGKSNILDAICFVLGLSKLEIARCQMLIDLIYKSGQAGVTTASVSIEIDNSDGKFSHTDYRHSKTIIVRREINIKNQSKYYIDGFSVTREKLLDFFHSVSLNIQNPHFLIMQGKIVKVISMKPIEVLSMIQESVGVSVYENKKKHNMAKIEKYDLSLNEYYYMIEHSIKPKLKQLKEEEKSLNEYRNVSMQLESMNKISIAYRFMRHKELINSSDSTTKKQEDLIEEKREENLKLTNETETLTKEIGQLQCRLDEEMGGDLKELEQDLQQKQANNQQLQTNKQLKLDQMNEEQQELKKLKQKYQKDQQKLDNKMKEYENLKIKIEQMKEENDTNEKMLLKAQEDFEAIALGLSKGVTQNGDDQSAAQSSLTQQLITAKDSLIELESNINKSKLIIQQNGKELKEQKHKVQTNKDVYEKSSKELEQKQKEIDQLKQELDQLNFNEENFDTAKHRLVELRRDYQLIEDQINQLMQDVPGFRFKYPYNDIDHSDIIGVVADLFTVNRPEYEVAVEKVCGGRLFHVVVTDHEIAATMLRKNLKERRTFLPLNKITGRDTDRDALRQAERLVGKGNVFYAINLVTFDTKLRDAMKFVFGDTMVCPNMAMAKKVAFAPGIMKRVVTFDGDIFDPSGTLTGGALKQGPQILSIINQIKRCQDDAHRMRVEQQQHQYDCDQQQRISKEFYEIKLRYDRKLKELELLRQRQEESSHYQLVHDIEQMEQTIKQEQDNIEKYSNEKQSIQKIIKDLEYKIKNFERTKERERKETKEFLDEIKKKSEQLMKKYQKEQQNFECLTQELKHQQEQVYLLQKQIDNLQEINDKCQQELNKLQLEIDKSNEKLSMAQEKYDQYKMKLTTKSQEIRKLQKNVDKLKNQIDENEREIKLKLFELEKIQGSIKESKDQIKYLLHKYQWIKEEEKFFYSSDSEYGILNDQNFNEEEFNQKLKHLKSIKDSLAKSVNMKANIMHGEKQKEFEDLLKKCENVRQDKKKVLKYIEKVEREKETELIKAWEKINVNFGSIFSTLLPNANCKLVPIKGNIQEGFEIKVAFGEVWKDSLSELSGGQRSLVALSLVLALLKYNPAPLYILDEIDAALDQSHTQNIGIMIRRHFQNAQFIIVSLKDDMFSNANVLFQTKFIDGYSTVTRIERGYC